MRPPGLPIDFWDVKRRGIIFPSTDIRVCPFEDCQHASSYGGLRAHIRTVHRDWPLLKRKTRPWRKIMPRPSQQENQVTASRQTSWNGKELFQEALRDRRHRSVRISCLKEQWAAILDRQNDAGSEDTHPNVVRRIWMELPDQFREQLVEPHSATTAKAEIRFSDSEVCRFIEDCYIYALENSIFHENQLHGLPDAEVFPKALPCWDDLVDDSFDVYDFMGESSESQDDYSGDMSVTEECSQEPDVQNRMSGSEQNDPDDMGIGRVAELEHQMSERTSAREWESKYNQLRNEYNQLLEERTLASRWPVSDEDPPESRIIFHYFKGPKQFHNISEVITQSNNEA